MDYERIVTKLRETISTLQMQLTKERKNNRDLEGIKHKMFSDKSNLEKVFIDCLNTVRKDV